MSQSTGSSSSIGSSSIATTLLPEFDQEMASTRKTLERVPEDRFAWKPHAKSFSMIELATHVANVPGWGTMTITEDSFDVAPGGVPMKDKAASSVKELLEKLDTGVSAARAALLGASDAHLLAPWSLLGNGETYFSMPRVTVLRSFVMNHLIHHRAQLGLYLRLNDIPVPAIYGPSADDSGM